MKGKREPRATGERIILGGVEYYIEGVEGSGGTAIVYRAFYRDRLNRGSVHKVLIKELFPWHPKGLIYRGEDGCLCCDESARELFLRCRESFYQGNQANLDLLEHAPGQIAGNLNSFEAYGTFYSVLSVHGGKTLQKLLDEGEYICTLHDAAEAVIRILDALECFHENGILHLDISPDNILMLPSYSLLIDYNSVWPMEREPEELWYFSEKEGYSAPEVTLQEERNITPATDIYSVSAVFFRMLTGRRLAKEDLMGRGAGQCLKKDLEIFCGEPESAVYKAVQVVVKGLHVLARKRYQSTSSMKEDLKELLCRIEGKGISYSAIWEGSVREQNRMERMEEPYLKRSIRLGSGEEMSEGKCYQSLLGGSLLLMTGAGGMGKTQFLMKLWKEGTAEYKNDQPVVVYIPLAGYQETGEETDYIKKYLIRHICFHGQTDTMEEALHELNRLVLPDAGKERNMIFLLDGFNEAGSRTRHLLKEIESLGKRKDTGILLTDRTEAVKSYGLYEFETVELLPLNAAAVEQCLEESEIRCPNQEVFSLLSNPMMLSLYRQASQMPGASIGGSGETFCPDDMKDMVRYYLDHLCRRELRKDSGNQEEQLRHQYLIRHLLPELAIELRRRKKTLFTVEELYSLIRKNYCRMQGKEFGMAFPEYMGKSRLMLRGIANEREWFDYAVSEQLTGRFSLMVQNPDGNYRMIHDNFVDSLSEWGEENRKKLGQYQRRYRRKKVCFGLLALFLVAGAVRLVWRGAAPSRLSKEADSVLRSAVQRLEINLGICNTQINAQKMILKEAKEQGVLDGKPQDILALQAMIERQSTAAEAVYSKYRDGANHIERMEEQKIDLPVGVIVKLYGKPAEMRMIMQKEVSALSEKLCDEDSVYNDSEKREPLVLAYQEYLDAYTNVSFLEASQVIFSLKETGADESAEELMASISEMESFWDCIGAYSLGSMTEEEIRANLQAAERKLEAAESDMAACHLPVPHI